MVLPNPRGTTVSSDTLRRVSRFVIGHGSSNQRGRIDSTAAAKLDASPELSWFIASKAKSACGAAAFKALIRCTCVLTKWLPWLGEDGLITGTKNACTPDALCR